MRLRMKSMAGSLLEKLNKIMNEDEAPASDTQTEVAQNDQSKNDEMEAAYQRASQEIEDIMA